jgi:two-component system, OmpR family, phosphate regulon sensor histidine kinase PhoR
MSSRQEPGRTSLAARLVLYGSLAALVLVIVVIGLVDRSIRGIWLNDLDSDLETLAATASEGLPSDPAGYQEWADRVAEAGGVRVTLIDLSGLVIADSHQDPAVMDNHVTRPEVTAALAGEVGRHTRISTSTGLDQRYVALPPDDSLIVRVATATSVIEGELDRTRRAIATAALVGGLVGVALLGLFGRRIARPVTALVEQAQAIAVGDIAVRPPRSPIGELDRLGLALSAIARNLGGRVADAEQASSLLEVVLGAIPQGTVLFDSDDRVAYLNPAAAQILGSVPDSLGVLTPHQLQVAVGEARETRETVSREVDHGRPARRLRGMATPFVSDGRVLLVIVDITERVRTDSIRRDFVANASHELKTPVATIIAAAEALQIALSRRDASAEMFATQIESSARQLDRLVADLLDLSRLERETLQLAPIQFDAVVLEEVERVRHRVEDNNLAIHVETTPVVVMGSGRDLAAAVRNLLDNAIRYTLRDGRIAVVLGVDETSAVLRVTDTGEGIPTRDLDRVFERFYRVDSARARTTGGTGLGLAIVRHVAESHGGSATAESELGQGSTFEIRLPLQTAAQPSG